MKQCLSTSDHHPGSVICSLVICLIQHIQSQISGTSCNSSISAPSISYASSPTHTEEVWASSLCALLCSVPEMVSESSSSTML